MEFDPAVAAREVFAQVQASNELGDELVVAVEAYERFSSSAGNEASEAYRELIAIGASHPEALAFGEFLVYITWSHLMDETHSEHFSRGLALCQDLLRRDSGGDEQRVRRLRAMERSFRAGLTTESGEGLDYDADLPKGEIRTFRSVSEIRAGSHWHGKDAK
jgi:hypothetical protein